MPAYEYYCDNCRNSFEIWGSVEEYSQGLIKSCPFCGSKKFEQKLSAQIMKGGKTGSGGSSCCGPNSGSGCCG